MPRIKRTKRELQTIANTLAFVNKVRERQGRKPLKRLPKGDPSEYMSCPIALAIQGEADTDRVCFTDSKGVERRLKPPASVRTFINKFDDEGYPEFIRTD